MQKRPPRLRSGEPSSVLLSVPNEAAGSRLEQCTLRRLRMPFDGLGGVAPLLVVATPLAAFSGEEPSVEPPEKESLPRRRRRVAKLLRRGEAEGEATRSGARRSSNGETMLEPAEDGAAVAFSSSAAEFGLGSLVVAVAEVAAPSVEEAGDERLLLETLPAC